MKHLDPSLKHDFVLLFDVQDGNPNGDPDAGNMPRVDPDTNQGLVTDVCLKRKIRDYVFEVKGDQPPFRIFVQKGHYLHEFQGEAKDAAVGSKNDPDRQRKGREFLCQQFYDVRTFGGVMAAEPATKLNFGQITGPLQLTVARSIDEVTPLDLSITRVTPTKEDKGKEHKETEMGSKWIVPYGLYLGYGFFTPSQAAKTGFTSADLEISWQALQMMWELDRAAGRGMMACRGLYVFTHDNALGKAPSHVLFEGLQVERRPGVAVPRAFDDYVVSGLDRELPAGVTLTRVVG